MYCKCHDVLTIEEARKGLVDEVKEFIIEPNRDELSDIAYAVNRLIGALLNREYVRFIPGGGRHVTKIKLRMQTYGCVRSERHLMNNQCPSS